MGREHSDPRHDRIFHESLLFHNDLQSLVALSRYSVNN